MTGALSGLRVVDFGQYIAGPLVAQLLGDQGAEVIRVERPGGPSWRSDANAVLQRGKHNIVLDLKDGHDLDTAREIIRRSDILVENFRPAVMDRLGLGYDQLRSENPRLVYSSIPGFASSDQRSTLYAHEGVVSSAAGLYAQRDFNPAAAPTVNTLPIASVFAALISLNSITAALIARERTGRGQRVEVSMFDAAYEVIRFYADRVTDDKPKEESNDAVVPVTFQLGGSFDPPTASHYLCADGKWVHLSWLEGRQLETFAGMVGKTAEWQAAGVLDIPLSRFWHDDRVRETVTRNLQEVFLQRPAAEWERIANPECDLTECQTAEHWLLYDEQARVSRAVVTVTDPLLGLTHQLGHPVSLSETPSEVQFARQVPDEGRSRVEELLATADVMDIDDAGQETVASALQGITAIDMCQLLAGPTVCRILAEYGADVIQIINPNGRAAIGYHRSTNGGKRSITLDLKKPGGLEVFERLVQGADVLSTNFSDAVATRLGTSEADVRKIREDIIYSRLSAHGNVGPRAEYRGHEQVGQTVTGVQVRFGKDADHPIMQPFAINDVGSGHLTAWGVLLGLYNRARTGGGQWVGSSLAHTASLYGLPFMVAHGGRDWDDPGGLKFVGYGPTERLYRATDGWFFLAAPESLDVRRALATVEGLEGLDSDDDLESQLAARFSTASATTWATRLAAAGFGAHKWNSIEEAMEDQWARSNGLSVDVTFADGFAGRLVGPAPRLSDTPMRMGAPAQAMGAETMEILRSLDNIDVEALVHEGTVLQPADLVEHAEEVVTAGG
ncbi:CaiB/BaiF CoA transferase family protein [Mycobacterium colombiense]|uniref:CaiB/BaiF CoA transferase family protein n=1 Tax=Mycobacterium colombiense TaxID=339268 RepID=UPI00200B9984|nr:CoA transferase [Mycobacterium colombiense]MCK8646704.1 CoA transferase [Mycobacterium colombiense]